MRIVLQISTNVPLVLPTVTLMLTASIPWAHIIVPVNLDTPEMGQLVLVCDLNVKMCIAIIDASIECRGRRNNNSIAMVSRLILLNSKERNL